jgi:CO/xanthine dehydrogenase Mo-binding subunit
MTCHELRLHFEDPLRMDAEFPGEADHLAHCTECARFVEARRKLGSGLRLVRESGPEPSEALKASVLANYRAQISGGHPTLVRSRTRRLTAVAWTAVAAAMLALAGALLLHPARRLETSNSKIESAQLPIAETGTFEKGANRVPWSNAASSPKTRLPTARRPRRAPPVATTKSPASEDFRSLMYCDALSCGGALQLIRVQLPSSAAAFEPAAAAPYGAIYADVLVGSDGIARGIRVVQ